MPKKKTFDLENKNDTGPHSYVNPRFDVAFRKLFNADTPEITISVLNTILNLTGKKKIVSVEFQDTTRPPISAGYRTTVQDLICVDQNKHQYLVELQVARQRNFFHRMVYYFSRMYSSQLVAGDMFNNLKPAYCIGILDFSLFNHTDDFHTVHKICDVGAKGIIPTVSDIEFHMIELSKFNKTSEQCKSVLDQWLFFFKHSERVRQIPLSIKEPVVKLAFEKIDEFNWTAKERSENEALIKAWRDHQEFLAMTKEEAESRGIELGMAQGIEKGLAKGIEQGLAQGIEKGLAQGIEKGVEQGEKMARMKIAKKMLDKGIAPEIVAQDVGLDLDDVLGLK